MTKQSLVCCVVLGVAIGVAANFTLAKKIRAREVRAPEQTGQKITHSKGATPLLGGMPLPDCDKIRTVRFPASNVTVNGRTVVITGQAEIEDGTGENKYLWLVRIYEANHLKTLVKEHHYFNQVFQVEGGHAFPTFADQVDLPPGRYQVQLILYARALGFDLARTQPEEDLKKTFEGSLTHAHEVTVE
jgi:hypothetical protein